ncbi:hypothetical protein [Pseudomonas sp. TTU2014-080ASC]|uniref:hypothetical protein n=1 Tax=Pseudomonas sp. TTU2014-080ASC TaxID=1729724 RepID=UPI00071849C7|nr:hypothetical protein [Pseudomonas sp. TTU2014-080ASC]KRW59406.1 hypothetical protein AO726_11345 [Pseudomonas sp. TTU2014-080ASC]
MQADWNDAPSYLQTRANKGRGKAWIIPGIVGTCITLGLLHLAGSAFLKGTVQNLAEKPSPAKPAPIAEITRSEKLPAKDWDRIVEEQARLDAQLQRQPAQAPVSVENTVIKQTVFNDQNYIPRGADNVLSLKVSEQPVQTEKSSGGLKVITIKEKPKVRDQACSWMWREGSIEQRNCRFEIGIENRK